MALNYNGIEFTNQNTSVHVMGSVKDPSGSDQLYTQITLKVRGIINIDYLPASFSTDSSNVSNTIRRIRHYLTAPRGSLYYDVVSATGGRSSNYLINLPSGRDDAGGPWPDEKAFEITYTTQDTFEVSWSCVVNIRDCSPSAPVEPLSVRWEDSISYDETWRATYKRTGTLIISTLQTNTIDWFRRNKISMPVCAGFKRVQASYLCSKDGLRCDFTFVDLQIRFAPPYPGVDMEIRQSESAPLVGGMRKGAVSVTIKGIIDANVVDLSRWSLIIMKSRVWAANPLTARGTVLGVANLQTIESPGGVSVEATCSYKVNPTSQRQTTLAPNAGSPEYWINLTGARPGATAGPPGVGATGGSPPGVFPAPQEPQTTGFNPLNPSTYINSQYASLVNNVATGTALGVGAQLTQQGKSPLGLPFFPWVGAGTSPVTAQNPSGFAQWANPTGSVGGPADGVGLAVAVKIFANLLGDPCGNQLDVNPNARGTLTQSDLSQGSPVSFNTASGGQGGDPSYSQADLRAASSGMISSQYPGTQVGTDNQGLTVWDGAPAAYDYWQCLNEYIDSPGIAVLPNSDPLGTNIKVLYSSAQVTLIKRWAAKRSGAPPALPNKQLADTNWVYVGGEAPQTRELGTAGDNASIVYEAYGTYIYQCLNAALVPFIAEIPPALDSSVLSKVSGWAGRWVNSSGLTDNTIIQVGSAPLTPSSLTGQGGGSPPSSPGGVLGTGTLSGPTPFGSFVSSATANLQNWDTVVPGVGALSSGVIPDDSGTFLTPVDFSGGGGGFVGPPSSDYAPAGQPDPFFSPPASNPLGGSSGPPPVLPNVPPPPF